MCTGLKCGDWCLQLAQLSEIARNFFFVVIFFFSALEQSPCNFIQPTQLTALIIWNILAFWLNDLHISLVGWTQCNGHWCALRSMAFVAIQYNLHCKVAQFLLDSSFFNIYNTQPCSSWYSWLGFVPHVHTHYVHLIQLFHKKICRTLTIHAFVWWLGEPSCRRWLSGSFSV